MWRRRTIAWLLILLQLSACTSWKPSKVTPEQTVRDENRILVRLTNRSAVMIRDPWVRGDTIGGEQFVPDGRSFRDRGPWAMPLDSVVAIETSHVNAWGTAGFVLFTVVLVGATAAVIALSDMCIMGPC